MVMSVKLQPAQKVESEYDEMDDVAAKLETFLSLKISAFQVITNPP